VHLTRRNGERAEEPTSRIYVTADTAATFRKLRRYRQVSADTMLGELIESFVATHKEFVLEDVRGRTR
jgi:hypothetical protein